MAELDKRKVLFFIAGASPTVNEASLIARTRGNVFVRSVLRSPLYGEKLESADALAGSIPDSYKTDEGEIDLDLYPYGDVTPGAEGSETTLNDGDVIEGVTVSGSGTTATVTVANGSITSIVLS